MPYRPPSPCGHPGCPELSHKRFCPKHQLADSRRRGSAASQGYGHRWRKLRQQILQRDRFCVHCKTAVAIEVDHIVPKRQGGTDDPDNLQGLCKPCHSRKTAKEDGRW